MGIPTIAIDARYVRERPSGIGSMVGEIIRRVPQRMPDVAFLLLRHPLAPSPLSTAPNVREVTFSLEANGPATLLLLPKMVDLNGVDLFHAPSNILPAGLPMRSVVTIHDTMWLTQPALCGASGLWGHVQTWFYRNGIRRALERADHIISISEATRADITRAHPPVASRCTTISHGISRRFRPVRNREEGMESGRARQRYAPGAKRHVLVVGRAAPYKNQERSVVAFLRAFQDEPDTHLIIIQRLGHDGDGFQRLARAEGAGNRVHVVPPMGEPDLIALYWGALCLLQPSICEGWGMPIGEAMACGCPVITSNLSAMPEVAGEAAIFVDPMDVRGIAHALRLLHRDVQLRAGLLEAGLLRAQRYSWERHADQTADLYRLLLKHTASVGA